MRIGASAHDRLLRRHAGEVDRLCLLALGDAVPAHAAAAAVMELAAAALAAGVRPTDGRAWLLGLAIAECDRRSPAAPPEGGARPSDDPWEPVRRLPRHERAALVIHEGLGLGLRRTASALGVEWRAVTDLLFSARRTLACPGDRWEPLDCTVHRRRLSDAGCSRVPPALSRAHVEECDGCRGMLTASAARRAAARPVAPASPSRHRLPRPGLALAAACAAILVGGTATLIGGGGAAPSREVVASADVAAAPARVARTPVPVPARPTAAQRPHPERRAAKRPAPRRREAAVNDAQPVERREAVAEIPASRPRRPSPAAAPARPATPPRRRAPAPRRSPSPAPSAPVTPPAAAAPPAAPPAATVPAPVNPPPVAAGQPTTTTPAEPAIPGGGSTAAPAPVNPPPTTTTTTGGTTTAP